MPHAGKTRPSLPGAGRWNPPGARSSRLAITVQRSRQGCRPASAQSRPNPVNPGLHLRMPRPNAMLLKCPAGRFFPASQPPPAATGAHKDNNDLQNVSLRDGDLCARPRWPGCATRGAQPMTAGIGEPMCKIAAAGAEHARIAPTDRTGFRPTRALASSCRVTAAIHDGTTRQRSRPGQQGDRGCTAAGSRHGAAVHGTGPAAPRKLVRTRGKSGAQRGPALFTLSILPTGGIRWKNFC